MSNRENGSGSGGSSNSRQDSRNRSSGRRSFPSINPEGRGYGQDRSEERFTTPKPGREPSGYGTREDQGRSGAFRDREGSSTRRNPSSANPAGASGRSSSGGRSSQNTGDPAGARRSASGKNSSNRGTSQNGGNRGGSPNSGSRSASGNNGNRSGSSNGGNRNGSPNGGNRNGSSSGGNRGNSRNSGSRDGYSNRNNNRNQDEIEETGDVRRFIFPAIIAGLLLLAVILVVIVMILLGKTLFHTDPVETIPTDTVETPETLIGDRKDLTPIPTQEPKIADTEPEETETTTEESLIDLSAIVLPDYVTIDLIDPNEYSRPQKPLKKVNDIVVHYVGNPGTSGAANVGYFKQLGLQEPGNPDGQKASSNFVIGLNGEVINCVPIDEVAYCSNHRNSDTISIECCHPDEEGKFTDATYASLIRLLTFLCNELELDETHIIRHYDVTGKECPRYYVRHPDAWDTLKLDLRTSLDAHPVNDGSWY